MVNLQLYTWVVPGRQRKAVLKALSHKMTPTEICKKSKHYNEKISLNNTSDILRLFAKKRIAVCLNPEAKIGRLYELTEDGVEIREELLKE